MNALRDLYYETAIIPSEEDFLRKANNYDMVYLVMRWLNLDQEYEMFIEEEMDLEAIKIMTYADFAYFGLEENEQFKQWVEDLKACEDEIPNQVTNQVQVRPPLRTIAG